MTKGDEETTKKRCLARYDVMVWSGGIAFIIVLLGVMFGLGHYRGWDANSGFTHNISATSSDRFLQEPRTPEPGVSGRYGTEAEARWYYWKLPPDKVTPYTRLFVWLCYVCHQMLAWAVTYMAQQQKAQDTTNSKYSSKLSKWNWISLGLHVFFHILHLLQTHTTYDALAQDVSIASSQGSVIMLLIFILLMEYKDRGVFFGWPSKHDNGKISAKLRLNYGPVKLIRRYHGYAFAWASIYTFWYHPMENTWGHCLGFAHTWIIMLQGSLMYTHWHRNRYWRLLLETWVTLHSGVVAYQTSGPEQLGTKLWPMFVFGFALIIVITQIFSLAFWRKIHWAFRIIPLALYTPIVLYMYSWIPDAQGRTWVRLQDIIRIPGVYYLYLIFAWIVLFVFLKIDEKVMKDQQHERSWKMKVVFLAVCVATYACSVGIAASIQIYDAQVGLIVLMIIFVAIFILGVNVSMMFLKETFPINSLKITSFSDTEKTIHSSKTELPQACNDEMANYDTKPV